MDIDDEISEFIQDPLIRQEQESVEEAKPKGAKPGAKKL